MSEASDYYPRFFHIGLPRTGTTTLQDVFRRDQRIALSEDRFFQTSAYYFKPVPFSAPGDRIGVHSDETLLRQGGDYFKMMVTLKRISVAVPDAHILLTIREQRAWLLSRYKYGIDSGMVANDLEGWLHSGEGIDFLSLAHYDVIYQSLLQYFPKDQIHVFLYEDLVRSNADFFRSVYRVLGLEFAGAERERRLNTSEAGDVLFYRRALNRLGLYSPPQFGAPGLGFRIQRRVFALSARALARVLPRSDKRSVAWPKGPRMDGLLREFAKSNAALEAMAGVALAQNGYMVGDPTECDASLRL